MAQLMPLPLTVSCFSKIQIGFTFLVPAHPGSPGKMGVKRVCVCVTAIPSCILKSHPWLVEVDMYRSYNICIITRTGMQNNNNDYSVQHTLTLFLFNQPLHYSYSGSDSFPNVLITEAGFYCVMLCQRSNCCCRVSVCESITSQYFIKNDWTNRADLWQAGFFPPISHSVILKFLYLQKLQYFPLELCPETPDLKNFAMASQSHCQQYSLSISLLTTPIIQSMSRGCLLQIGQLQLSNSIRFVANLSQNLFLQLTRF